MAAPHRELHRKGHPISLLWAVSLVSDLSELALPSGQRGGSSDLEIGHPGYPDLLSVHFVRYLNHTILRILLFTFILQDQNEAFPR